MSLNFIDRMTDRVLSGGEVSRDEALRLTEEPLEPLKLAAEAIRSRFCGPAFDLCSIVNGKSGRCSEDCRYCAQSARYPAAIQEYPLLGSEEILKGALRSEEQGILRFSVVTSGRALSDREVDVLSQTYRLVRSRCGISLCASHGLLNEAQFCRLAEAGVERCHNNLETSRRFFPRVCTTHSYDEKISALRSARKAGLSLCSGGILGLGETWGDRVDLALELRSLEVRSVPLNVLNPIAGTPFEGRPLLPQEEVCRAAAVFRFILPRSALRLAGGRGLMPDRGRAVLKSGANAAITGDMLTTSGVGAELDRAMVTELGFTVGRLP